MTPKTILKATKRTVLLLVAFSFIPWLTLLFVVCGTIEVFQQEKERLVVVALLLWNSVTTWLLSLFNLIIDALALP